MYVVFGLVLQTYRYFTQPLYLRIIATSLLIFPIALDVGKLALKTAPEGRRFGYCVVATIAIFDVRDVSRAACGDCVVESRDFPVLSRLVAA